VEPQRVCRRVPFIFCLLMRADGIGFPFVAALCVTMMWITGCGGGSRTTSNMTRADKSAIHRSITLAFTSDDPGLCDENATPALIQSFFSGSIARCERERQRGKPASSVAISGLSISGKTADAQALPTGGSNNGEKLSVALLNTNGGWKLDRIRYVYGSDPKTDRQVDHFLRSATKPALTRPASGCVQTRLRVAFRSAGVPIGTPELKGESRVVLIGCLRDHPSAAAPFRRAFLRGLTRHAETEVGRRLSGCVIAEFRRRITTEEIVEILNGDTSGVERVAKATGEKCGATDAILRALRATARI
jgi:hypothetical protein